MTTQAQRQSMKSDLVIGCVIFAITVGALIHSFSYSESVAMLLPRLAAGLGIACSAWTIVSKVMQLRWSTPLVPVGAAAAEGTASAAVAEIPASSLPTATEQPAEDEGDPNDAEYILSHTPRRTWAVALAFAAGFFILLYLCGIFVAAGALALAYLRVVGRKSWLFSTIYTAVS